MEFSFKDRDVVGVDDFILLEDFESIDAFVDNLKKRFCNDIIYTNIGSALISVNPYKQLPIYGDDKLEKYQQPQHEILPPHIYGLVESAYRSLINRLSLSCCIIISGESGAGKTEASKKVLEYVASATGQEERMQTVKNKLLQSNSLLEAFGNAKTNKNDNSSRFGKYMQVRISHEHQEKPIGGNIWEFLLEKSRVVFQNPNERNFHIFYLLLGGAKPSLLNSLHLENDLQKYAYLHHKIAVPVNLPSDKIQFQVVKNAMKTAEITESEQMEIFKIIASILHLGNVPIVGDEDGTKVIESGPLQHICELLGCDPEQVMYALTNRTIEVPDDIVITPLNIDQANYARDALAKAVYARLFTWLVSRLNDSLDSEWSFFQPVLGILDIYGFEIFEKNSYEQFCINYCNEKLQQLFIDLTLRQEQEEYHYEGIEWVTIKYFDNEIICELIEAKHKGIIEILNEECLRPGDTSDLSFLEKMNKNLSTHKHYISHMKSDTVTQKTMHREAFRLVHYAGEVTYNVNGFLQKNNDLLFRDLVELMTCTNNSIIKSIFPAEELSNKKRPDTAMNQFRNSLNDLMRVLSTDTPSYIRCIKPNDYQRPDDFNEELVKHQVQYLGLMENLKVRRAGFAYRRLYEPFLKRYKPLSRHTWPNFNGEAKEGVKVLLQDLAIKTDEYALGKTKLFIKTPGTLFRIEDAYEKKKHDIATIIQKMWRGRRERKRFLKIRQAIIHIQTIVRGFVARRRVERRKKAIETIKRFIKGYITRYGPETDINREFVQLIKAKWLINLSKNLPRSVLDKSWPPCPKICEQASAILRDLRMKQLALRYRMGVTPEMKKRFDEKVLAEFLFKGKKRLYESSVPEWFVRDRLTTEQRQMLPSFTKNLSNEEKILYSTSATKYDRHGYKIRSRALIFTDKHIYLLDGKSFRVVKHKILYKDITELTVTTEGDSFLLVRISMELKKDKGDLILSLPNLIETVTLFTDITQKPTNVKVTDESKILHYLINENPKTIKVVSGSIDSIPGITKGKTGELTIMG